MLTAQSEFGYYATNYSPRLFVMRARLNSVDLRKNGSRKSFHVKADMELKADDTELKTKKTITNTRDLSHDTYIMHYKCKYNRLV